MIESFKDLEVYKEAYSLALIVNNEVNKLPLFEKYDLGSQMRRASKSIPSNIAEGWAKRRYPKEFKRYLETALGSCNEMEVHVSLAKDLHFWKPDFCDPIIQRYVYLGGKLVNLRDRWNI